MKDRPYYRGNPFPSKSVVIAVLAVAMGAALFLLHGCACELNLVDFGPVLK